MANSGHVGYRLKMSAIHPEEDISRAYRSQFCFATLLKCAAHWIFTAKEYFFWRAPTKISDFALIIPQNHLAQGRADFYVEDEIGVAVQVGGVAVDDHQIGAVLFGEHRQAGGRIDDQGGAD